jgi:hypothetical protein
MREIHALLMLRERSCSARVCAHIRVFYEVQQEGSHLQIPVVTV